MRNLGGSVRLTGPITGIQPAAAFKAHSRPTVDTSDRRIDIDEGTVTLVGDLDPFLDFVARSSRLE